MQLGSGGRADSVSMRGEPYGLRAVRSSRRVSRNCKCKSLLYTALATKNIFKPPSEVQVSHGPPAAAACIKCPTRAPTPPPRPPKAHHHARARLHQPHPQKGLPESFLLSPRLPACRQPQAPTRLRHPLLMQLRQRLQRHIRHILHIRTPSQTIMMTSAGPVLRPTSPHTPEHAGCSHRPRPPFLLHALAATVNVKHRHIA